MSNGGINFMDVLNPQTLIKTVIEKFTKKFSWPLPKETHKARLSFPVLIAVVLILAFLGYILFRIGNK